jgi:hypothetical protein
VREDTPSAEEIQRVARYWQWVGDMACQHETITYAYGEPPACSDCGRPLRVLSDVQIEDLKNPQQSKETDET